MIKGEAVFKGETEVKYLFQKSINPSKTLIVVFSAFGTKGQPPTYNYVRTLEGYNCNKLYILDDFGCRASYYLCENRNFHIERSVISLINKIIHENDINQVISCGSSKGGYAAIYYGIKYNFDSVIAGSPQYLLGTYLFDGGPLSDVSSFISGGSEEQDKVFMDTIMKHMIRDSNSSATVNVHVGRGEYHYNIHVKPLIEELGKKRIKYDLDLGNYTKHSDVAKHFPVYLKKRIAKELGVPYIELINEPSSATRVDDKHEFKAYSSDPDSTFAWYIYKDGKVIEKRMYTPSNKTIVKFPEAGKYHLKLFVKNKADRKVTLRSKLIYVQ